MDAWKTLELFFITFDAYIMKITCHPEVWKSLGKARIAFSYGYTMEKVIPHFPGKKGDVYFHLFYDHIGEKRAIPIQLTAEGRSNVPFPWL